MSAKAGEAQRAFDAEEADLTLKVVAHVLGAVIVAKGEAMGDVLGEGAEALAHRLPDRLQGLEAVGCFSTTANIASLWRRKRLINRSVTAVVATTKSE